MSDPQPPEDKKQEATIQAVGNSIITIEPEKRPWDPQPDEPSKGYANFVIYMELGAKRNMTAAEAKARGLPKIGQVSGAFKNMAAKWQWKERAEAWDKAQGAIAQARRSEAMVDFTVEAKAAQEEAIMKLSQYILKAIDEKDEKECKRLGAMLASLVGRGKSAEFLLSAHKTLFGQKTILEVPLTLTFE